MSRHWSLFLFAVAACGGGTSNHGDAATDTAIDTASPGVHQIAITGVARLHGSGSVPAADIGLDFRQLDDDSTVGSTFTAADGTFTQEILSSDTDIYIEATGSNYVTTRYNFQFFAAADASVAIDMFTPAAYAELYSSTEVTLVAGTGTLEALAYSFDTGTESGVQLAIGPPSGVVKYDAPSGGGDPTATSTAADGLGYFLNAETGTVSWQSQYGTASSREVRVFPDEVSEVTVRAPFGAD